MKRESWCALYILLEWLHLTLSAGLHTYPTGPLLFCLREAFPLEPYSLESITNERKGEKSISIF